jgi:putative thioredoxin
MTAQELREKAQVWIERGDRYQAVFSLKEAALLEPTNHRIHHELITLLIKMNQLDSAIQIFDDLPLRAQVSRGLGIAIAYVFFAKSLKSAQTCIFSTSSHSEEFAEANMQKLVVAQHFLVDRFEEAMNGLLEMMQDFPHFDDGWAQKGLVTCLEYLEDAYPELTHKFRPLLLEMLG